jgi:ADP-ribose pyrophosphatase YjhB (NUDIX family)
MSPRFANRQNPRHLVGPERWVYDSRSVAVTAVVVAFDAASGAHHALASLRGPAVDHSNEWCLVCGYLDWDERLDDAIRREVFEEAGIDLAALEAAGHAVVPSQPIWVQSDPKSHRQNVTARFSVELSVLTPPTTANAERDEVLAVKWMPLVAAEIDAVPWAFGHDRILHELAVFLETERRRGSLDAGSVRRYYRARLERQYPFA